MWEYTWPIYLLAGSAMSIWCMFDIVTNRNGEADRLREKLEGLPDHVQTLGVCLVPILAFVAWPFVVGSWVRSIWRMIRKQDGNGG